MKLVTKLSLIIVLITLGCGVAMSVLVSSYTLKTLERRMLDDVGIVVDTLATHLSDSVINEDPVTIREILHGILSETRGLAFAYLTDSDGKIVAHTFGKELPKGLLKRTAAKPEVDEKRAFVRFADKGNSYLIGVYPLLGGVNLGTVHVGINRTIFDADILKLTTLILTLSLLVTIGGIFIAIYAALRVTRPLKQLTLSISDFGSGKTTFPVMVTGGSEIQQLSTAFRRMVERRDETEEAKNEERALIKTMIDSIPGAFYMLDAKGCYVRWNAYQRDEIVGKPEDQMAGTAAINTIHPDDQEFVGPKIENVLRGGKPEVVAGRVLLRGGPEYRWLLMTGRSVLVKGIPFLVGIGIDITDQRRSEEALQESRLLTDAVVEHVPLMIFLKEATDLCFVLFNRAGEELLGYDRRDLLGKNNLDLFPPEQAAHFMAEDREVLDGKTDILDIPEEPIMTAKKGQRLLHTRKVCIRGADGATKYLLGISEDITDRKHAEEQIKTSLREKEVLLKEIQHRVKNNLLTISGILALQLERIKDNESRDAFITSMNRINAMTKIHTRLYQSEDYSLIHFKGYMEELLEELSRSYGFPHENLIINIQDISIDINTAIPAGLIVNELVSNAMKHAFPDGRKGQITVTLSSENAHSILTISDNGIGCPPQIDFRNAETVGFSLLTQLVEQMNGTVELLRDKGSQFIITFWADHEGDQAPQR